MHAEAERATQSLRRGPTATAVTLVLAVFAMRELSAVGWRWAVLLWSLPVLYLGARVALDAMVFQRWAAHADLPAAMSRFDLQLERYKLRSAAAPRRGLQERIEGALRLRRALLACVAAQAACALGAFLLR
jgi:hypothetical protein